MRLVPHHDLPPDPFADDPEDPAKNLGVPDDEPPPEMSDDERADLIADLNDLTHYQSLLEPTGVRGIVVDCADCDEPHYHDWTLLRASLEQLLGDGRIRPHEPAYAPNPDDYVSWDYCRGYADGRSADQKAR